MQANTAITKNSKASQKLYKMQNLKIGCPVMHIFCHCFKSFLLLLHKNLMYKEVVKFLNTLSFRYVQTQCNFQTI